MALIRRRGEAREEHIGVLHKISNMLLNPWSLTFGTLALGASAVDGIFGVGAAATFTPAWLLGIAVNEGMNAKARKYDDEAEDVPPRPKPVKSPKRPDLVIDGYGGSTIRGVGASERWKQVAAITQDILEQRLGKRYGLPDLKVAFVNNLTEAEGKSNGLYSQAENLRGFHRRHHSGRSSVVSVVAPDIADARAGLRFEPANYRRFFGAITSGASDAVTPLGDSPALVFTPHDFSSAPSVKWYLRRLFRRRIAVAGERLEKMAGEFNRNRPDSREIKVIRGDHEFSDVLASDPERYFDRRTGRNLGDDAHAVMAEQLADALEQMIIDHAATLERERREYDMRLQAARRSVTQARRAHGGQLPEEDRETFEEVKAEQKLAAESRKAQFSPRLWARVQTGYTPPRAGRNPSTGRSTGIGKAA